MFQNIIMEILGIIIFWLCLMILTLIHEAGHLAGYKLASGDDGWHITLGIGKPLLKTNHMCVHIIPWSGMFQWQKTQPFTKKENILISAGGPIFSLVLALFFLIFQSVVQEGEAIFIDNFRPINTFVRNYNIIMFITSIIPMKYPRFIPLIGNHESDGMQILKLLQQKTK